MKKPVLQTITPEVKAEIKDIASRLGAIPRTRKVANSQNFEIMYPQYRVLGSQLIEMGHKDKDTIKPNQYYLVTSNQPEMLEEAYHKKQLEAQWMVKGYQGILEYSTMVKEARQSWLKIEADMDAKTKEQAPKSSDEAKSTENIDIESDLKD